VFPRFRKVPGADLTFIEPAPDAIGGHRGGRGFLALPHGVAAEIAPRQYLLLRAPCLARELSRGGCFSLRRAPVMILGVVIRVETDWRALEGTVL